MKLQLLGSPRVRFGTHWTELPPSRPMLLVFYLALQGSWVSREELAFFFRPEADEAAARHYVRKMLSDVRQLPWAGDLEVEKDRLRWQVDTDVKRFSEAARAGRWAEALALYHGPLLGSLRVDNSPSFEAWLELGREELTVLWQGVCLGHATELESAGEHREAAAIAKALLDHDSLAEDAVQSYIRNTYLAGRRESALRAAAAFRQELSREMGLEPLPETKALIEAVECSQPVARAAAQRRHGRRSTDRPLLPAKEQQLAELLELLQDPNARLLDLSATQAANESLIISRRLQDVPTALHAIVNLAEGLVSQGHLQRAGELLALVLKHPLCDDKARMKAHHLESALAARAAPGGVAVEDSGTPT
jgi:DNA-binding SARP family transcriptional activator